MARTNLAARRLKPEVSTLLTLEVVRRERISPSFIRVTLGARDVGRFAPMGFDQWFRLFIPVSEDSLARLPNKLDSIAYLRYLAIAKTERPVLRNYTVRAYRATGAAGAELDVDFVIHGSAEDGTAGPAASWAETCDPGDIVAILDEGIGFNPRSDEQQVVLVADETGVPAAAGILESLPRDAIGYAVLEVPAEGDQQGIDAPLGMAVTWVVRGGDATVPGVRALEVASGLPVPSGPVYAWAVGEQSLPASLRRHWVAAGVAKDDIMFCGYWKASKGH